MLAARLLKARYFPRTSFLKDTVGYMPSYLWRNFLSARELIYKGIRWNLGKGDAINIWEDSWIVGHEDIGVRPNIWIPSTKHAAVNFVGRDFKADVWGSGVWGGLVVNSVIEAEAKTVLFALDSARTGGVKRIIIEMDSLTLYKALKDGAVLLQIKNLINEILSLASTFECC
ncbi:hypothetical protein POM88_027702 [Heracleum sosnowskyi]|uniref:RNase H type-1 domain-containing protein n=1 Tax=Heracleum sosnowskyi TaxID=360622 RepID=A0AAD8MR95_9APIA|nr:hypothetical protein POM88_027702 [Heracleum sosnowskyi]